MAENKYKEVDLSQVLGEPFPDDPERKLDNSLKQGMEMPAQQGAVIDSLSRDTGLDHATVERNQAEVEKQNRYKSIDLKSLVKDTPTTAEFLSTVDNARQAHEDIGSLTKIELAARNREYLDETGFGERLMARTQEGWSNLKNAVANLSRIGDIDRGAQAEAFGDYIMGYDPGGNPIWMSQSVLTTRHRESLAEITAETGRDQSRLLARDAAAHMAKIKSLPTRPSTRAMLESENFGDMWDAFTVDPIGIIGDIGLTSAVQQVPALAATVAFRNPGIAMAAAGGNSYALEMGHGITAYLSSAGVDVTDPEAVMQALSDEPTVRRAISYANTRGTIVGGLDLISAGVASKSLVSDALIKNKAVNEALNTFVVQPVVQGILGATGEGGAQLATEGEISGPGELFAEAIGEFSHAPIEATAFAYERYRKTRADAARLDQATQAAELAKLRESNPEAFRELMQRMGLDADADVVYLDAEAAQVYFQGDVEQELLEQPAVQAVLEDLPAAIEAGRDIEIPIADYLTELVGTGFTDLQPHMRMSPEVLTPAQLVDTDVQAEIDRLSKLDKEELQAESGIYNDVLGQLLPITDDRGTAETYAMAWEAFFQAQAKRPGIIAQGLSPMDLYERYSPSVGREIDPAVQRRAEAVTELEVMLDRLRAGDVPRETDIFGETAVQFILDRGGIKDEGGELAARDVDVGRIGKNRIGRQVGGLSLDAAAELLAEARFIDERDEQLVIDAIEAEIGGSPRYAIGSENAELQEVSRTLTELDDILNATGLDIMSMTNEEIVAALEARVGDEAFEQLAPEQFEIEPIAQGTGLVIKANDGDQQLGTMRVDVNQDSLNITTVNLRDDRRGEGIGQQFIQQAYEQAQERGKPLVSDTAVSVFQLRVYEALKRRGWTVEYADPENVAEKLQLADDAEAAGKKIGVLGVASEDDSPVVTRIEPPLQQQDDLTATQQLAQLVLNYDETAIGKAAALMNDIVSAPRPTETTDGEAFQTWFGDSKVVDENGDPLVVYHGTDQEFESFDPQAVGVNYADTAGFFFSSDQGNAEGFSRQQNEDGGVSVGVGPVMSVYLSLQNPLELDAGADDPIEFWFQDRGAFEQQMIEGDHDGVIVRSEDFIGDAPTVNAMYVARHPEQIKSTDNVGAFDPDNPNILLQQDLGLYSAVSKAVESMPLPEWKAGPDEYYLALYGDPLTYFKTEEEAQADFDDRVKSPEDNISKGGSTMYSIESYKPGKPASGKAIWQKLIKMPGVKKEELEWTGLEDFLMAGDKYTRQQVLNFIAENGVVLEETVATDAEPDRGPEQLTFDGGRVWDDPEAWQHEVEDALYEYDHGSNDTAGVDVINFTEEWAIENMDKVLAIYEPTLAEDVYAEIEATEAPRSQLDAIDRAGFDWSQDIRAEARDDFEEHANQVSAERYFENPIYIYATEGDSAEIDLWIFGNDDQGYSIREGGWELHENDVGIHGIYSIGEAEIRANDYARENELTEWISEEDDQDVAKWSDYVEAGGENYREVKIKLPTDREFKGEYKDYYNDVHFPDPNIIAFLRVTDRELRSGPGPGRGPTPHLAKGQDPAELGFEEITFEEALARHRTGEAVLNSSGTTDSGGSYIQGIREGLSDSMFTRFNDKPGVRNYRYAEGARQEKLTYFVDEFQSDWHQEGRQVGYKDPGADEKGMIDNLDRIQMAVESDFRFAFDAEVAEPSGLAPLYSDDVGVRDIFAIPLERDTAGSVNIDRNQFVQYAWNIMRGSDEATGALEDRTETDIHSVVKYRFVNDVLNRHIDETDQDALRRGVARFDESDRELDAQRKGVPDAPFKNDAWIALGLKRALIQAVDDGYTQFAWADGETLVNRWSDRYRTLYEMQYDKKMPSLVKKLTKQKPQHLRPDGTPMDFEITFREPAAEDKFIKTIGTGTMKPVAIYEHLPGEVWAVERSTKSGAYAVRHPSGSFVGNTGLSSEEEAKANLIRQVKHENAEAGYWMIEIDETLADKVRDEGFSMFQEGGNKPRGYFDPANNRITLTDRANLSTFLHESGHFFLNVLRDLAVDDQSIQNDLSKLEDWWTEQGAKDDRARHEMFASGFETYLQEGKAPTPELDSMFARFRSWLVMIYKRLGEAFRRNKLAGVELSDEVRGVMDRLVASQDAIDRVQESDPVGPLPVEQIGLTPVEAREYQTIVDAGNDEAVSQLQAEVMRESQREREKWWRDSVAEKVGEIDAEMSSLPAYRARDFLSGDVIPEGMEALKLDRAYVKDIYGGQASRKLQRMSAKDGVKPDVIAPYFGFRNGDELVRELLSTMNKGERAAYVKKLAEDRMRSEHGEMATDGSIDDKAQQAVANDKQAERLLLELRFLNRSAGRQQTPRQFFKAAAERAIAETPIDKVRPDVHRRNEIKARNAAVKFAAEEDFDAAALEQHKAVRQFYLYREAMQAKTKAAGHQRRLAQMKKVKYSARSVHPDYIQQLKVLLAAYDLRKNPKDSNARLDSVRNFVASQRETNPDLIADRIINQITNWKSMTLTELKAVRDAAENLLKIGKDNSDADRAVFKQMVDAITTNILDKTDAPKPQHTNHSLVSRARKAKAEFGAAHRKLESLLQELDGWEDNGPMAEAVFRPLWDAQLAEMDRLQSEHEEMNTIFDGYEYLFNSLKDSLQDIDATRKYVDLHTMQAGHGSRALSRGERIVLALNWGNEGNRQALRTQEGHEFTDAEVMAALETLTAEELALVNRLWEYVDKFYPELAKTEQAATGVAPAKVEASPFEVNGVPMRGGYFPLQADSALSWKAEMHEIEKRAQDMKMGGKARATTKHGSTIERVGFGKQIIDLSIDSLFKHVDGVVHDITHRAAVLEVDRILRDPALRDAASAKIGREGYRAISQAVVRLAGGNIHPSDLAVLNRLMRFSRVATSYGAMGYSVRTGIINITGLLPAIPEVGKTRLASALMREIANPLKFGREIREKSVFMENRGVTIERDVFEVMRNLKGHTGWNSFKAHAFWMITKVDAFVSRAVWWAAYMKALNEHGSEEQAVFDADRTVTRTQGSGMKIDLSAVEDQNEIYRAMSPMYTYFNAILNLAKRQKGKKDTGQISNLKYLENMFWIFIAVAIVEEALFGHSDEGETDEEKLERYARANVGYYLGQWFGIRELSGYVEYGQMFETPLQRVLAAPPKAAGEALELAFDPDAEFDKQSVRAATDLLPVLGFPSGAQVNRMGKYLMEYEETGGEFDLYGFLVTGRNDDTD